MLEALGLLLLTGSGGIALGWFYLRWQRNIWIPISVHVLGNLSWEVFDVADTALGGWFPFAMQATMMLLGIVFTLAWTGPIRRRDGHVVQFAGARPTAR